MVAPTTESSSKLKMKFSLDDFRLSDALEVVQRRWTTLAACVLVCWALGLVYCYIASTTYESSGQVLIMKKDSQVTTTTTGSSTKPEISEDLLATHMMIVGSKNNVGTALSRTVRLSKLAALNEEHRKKEEQQSNNLRIWLARRTGAIKIEELPLEPHTTGLVPAATDAAAAGTTPVDPAATTTPNASTTPTNTVPAPAVAPTVATPAVTAPATTNPSTATTTPPAPTTPTAIGTPAATTPASGSTSNPATPLATPGTAPAAAPLTSLPAATLPGDPTADVGTATTTIEQVTDPTQIRTALDEPPQEPVGPTADGDEVIMLADLPGIKAELKTGEYPVDYVIDNLTVTKGGDAQARDSHVLGISFRHKNAVEAKLVLDAVIKSYQNFLSDKFADVNREAAKLIEQASKGLKVELDKTTLNYQKFREQSPILFSGDQATNIHRQRLEQYNADLIALSGELVEKRSRLEKVELELATREKKKLTEIQQLALIDETSVSRLGTLATIAMGQAVATSESFQILQTERVAIANLSYGELTKREAELEAMLQEKGTNHPDVQALRRAIDVGKKRIDDNKIRLSANGESEDPIKVTPRMIMDAYLQLLRTDVDSLQTREQELIELAREEEERAKALYVYEMEGDRLRQEVAQAQSFYDAVVDRLRELDMAKDYSGFVNELIMPPEFGAEVWPSVPLVLALCTLIGGMLGTGVAATSEFRDRSFRDPDDIRRDLDMPLLTHVPDLRGKGVSQPIEGSLMHASMYTYHKPKSREAEVFRGLRTSLFFSNNAQKAQVIMLTSPNQGDGKSTVAANLAVSIAQTGRKVLMIDCDLRRPNVHRLYGLNNNVGLSDVIGGEVEPWDAIQQTETTNLWAMPAGPIPSNPAELLQSTTFEQLLKLAREKYDYVLLDCPPVLAVADPCIVAPRADGIALVLRVSRDSKPQANRAKEMLARVHGRMLGVVVNATQEAAKSGYGRYGDAAHAYSYDYGYGKSYGRGYSKYYEEDPSMDRANGSGR